MELRYTELNFRLIAEGQFTPSRFFGNTLRGAFGLALRRLLCTTKLSRCTDCPLIGLCIYQILFESRLEAGRDPSKSSFPIVSREAPHPFILKPPLEVDPLEPGDLLEFGINLFGKAIKLVPYIYLAVDEMGRAGIGAKRTPFKLVSILDGSGRKIFSSTSSTLKRPSPEKLNLTELPKLNYSECHISFRSPCRLKVGGRISDEFDFPVIVKNLLRRLSAILFFYEEVRPDPPVSSNFGIEISSLRNLLFAIRL